MKKFLVILMVVAMASFLFVGCLPSVTPDVDEDEDEDEDVVVPTSATPVLTAVQESDGTSIFTVTSTSTLYMNDDEVGDSILVEGTAPSESLVQIYIDDVAIAAAVGETATSGLWTIAIAASSLGDDGVKVMTAKVTEVGLAESAASNSVTFTLDTVDPGIDSVAATAVQAVVTDSAVATALASPASTPLPTLADISTIDAVVGTWTIYCQGDSTVGVNNVVVTSPTSVSTSYIYTAGVMGYITGINTTLDPSFVAGDAWTIVVTAGTAVINARAKIVFDEDIGYTGMTAGTYAIGSTAPGDPDVYSEADEAGYWLNETTGAEGASLLFTVIGITDKAGNIGGTSASPLSATCTIGAASATTCAP